MRKIINWAAVRRASKKTAKSFSQEVTGTLKIGLPASISYLPITAALPSFLQKFPQLKIQMVHGNHLLDLLRNGFDLIIHCGELPDSSFYFKKIGDWKKIICASPAYLKKYGTPKSHKIWLNISVSIIMIISKGRGNLMSKAKRRIL